MHVSVLASLLEVYKDDTIATSGSVDCGCCTVLEDVDGLDIRRVDVGQVSSRNSSTTINGPFPALRDETPRICMLP